jgi:hypothetical protein
MIMQTLKQRNQEANQVVMTNHTIEELRDILRRQKASGLHNWAKVTQSKIDALEAKENTMTVELHAKVTKGYNSIKLLYENDFITHDQTVEMLEQIKSKYPNYKK